MWLLLLLWPPAEIAAFIWVGERIGVAATLLWLLLATLAGLSILRRHGAAALRRAVADAEQGRSPAPALREAGRVTLAGLLLILPGFLGDAVAAWLLLRGDAPGAGARAGAPSRAGPGVLEGEYRRID